MKTVIQTEKLPEYPLVIDQQDELSVVPGIHSKLLRDVAWLIISSGMLLLFWQTSSRYAVYSFDDGRSGLRVHLFGVLVQERGYFSPQGGKLDYGIPFGGALFTALQVILLLITAYCVLRVLVDLIRCIPRRVYGD
ncbi:MAG TPA: hypothetical protein PLN21_11805 [Gemmatales bacterium]|nr:hypothetical protein [Gemmatales bacterium]